MYTFSSYIQHLIKLYSKESVIMILYSTLIQTSIYLLKVM